MASTVIFQPSGRRARATNRVSVLELARRQGLAIVASCGGQGSCGKCKVKVSGRGQGWRLEERKSPASPLTTTEKRLLSRSEIQQGYRLACMTYIETDAVVYIPPESRADGGDVVLADGAFTASMKVEPSIKLYPIEMTPPTLTDHRGDSRRLEEALTGTYGSDLADKLTIDFRLLRQLPEILRKNRWSVTAVIANGEKIVGVLPADHRRIYGVAIDIGTTTLAASLYSLSSTSDGSVLARASSVNSQVRTGDDVISRLSYCQQQPEGLSVLSSLIREDIDRLLGELVGQVEGDVSDIWWLTAAGNTVMEHIALGIEPVYIGKSPFIAPSCEAVEVQARELELTAMNPAGIVHFLPHEAGFVGGDNVAVLLAGASYRQKAMTLTIDIGTNGEIDFGNCDGIMSTSCATGPALEGAQLTCGMRAASGAIEKVKIDEVNLAAECKVIGNTVPRGICGSGIIDAVAEMVRAGIVKKNGAFNKTLNNPLVRKGEKGWEYVLVPADKAASGVDITITQGDVRALQLAKAALFAGADLLYEESGGRSVEQVVLAGAFGSYIDRKNALAIGLLPMVDESIIRVVGNAAGEGARLALLNREKSREADELAPQVKFLEAACDDRFQRAFIHSMDLTPKKLGE